ncbi:site-specific integrase [Flavobacterium sp. SOK18b]|jgi:integrase|uniref:Site-specific integrase n=3 Tax=Flavobacterium TaxID=237 RepID=A0A4R5AQ63_9FLAO|nr:MULTISPECIES: site-specific integrase [Flavobacterium]MBB1194968.1 site-specific integrase [Flavobacterium sp. SOK18b]MBC5841752.1 site-specific integrase [Flavobacterium kayseriense]MBC5848281.1 site-specific integrase [Flavobacterium kayseriense]MBC5864360.1 site-specific integrase [Flavobacterium turcicum]NHL02866.1 site-specific integrase [Flavobacterium turcicum]
MKNINVTLRKRMLPSGKITLYLDFFPPVYNPKTHKLYRREYLSLYLVPKPKNNVDKTMNSENLYKAEIICANRFNEVNKSQIYNPFELEQLRLKEIGEKSFLQYLKLVAEHKTGNNGDIWTYAIIHFENFLKNEDLLIQDIDVTVIEDFREYLLKAKCIRKKGKFLAQNTALTYFNKIKATLRKAYKKGLLQTDVNAAVESIKEQESQRNFLTMEEAVRLFKTPCKKEIVKRVSLFSLLTGMRYSDISKLTWEEVQYSKSEGYYIRFKQQKTDRPVTLPISPEAFEFLGEKVDQYKRVFYDLKKWDVDRLLPIWVNDASIEKHITFHCFRHTYATLQMAAGTDIFTVSKMLGHKNIKTTQIYTKIIDEKKRETTNKISFK